jgi:hypothetical protein
MVAAGIATPVPLDELECHLREEVERQIQSGTNDQEAFQRTVLHIGQAQELKVEFAKAGNFLAFLGDDKFTIIHRILGALWLVLFSLGFVVMSREIILQLAHGRHGGLLIGMPLWAMYGAGVGGSVLVIRGAKPGRWIVGTLTGFFALFSLAILFGLIPTIQMVPVVKVTVFIAVYAISSCLMFLPSNSNIKPAKQ